MVVNELVTKLRLNTDPKDAKTLKELDKSTQDLGKSAEHTNKVLDSTSHKIKVLGANLRAGLSHMQPFVEGLRKASIAIAGTVAGLTALSLSTAKSVKETEKLANKLGIEVNELQELEYVSQNAGLEVNELTDSLLHLRTGLNGVGKKGERTRKQITDLGVSLKNVDGSSKNTSEIFSEVADSLTNMNNATKKTLISERLLGTTNDNLISTFSKSNKLIAQQREEFRKLGYTIDKKAIANSKEFIKNWNTIKTIFENVKKQIAFSFMPIFNDFVKVFKKWNMENREFINNSIAGTIGAIGTGLKFLFGVVTTVTTPLFALFKKIITLVGGMQNALEVAGIAASVYFAPAILKASAAMAKFTIALLRNPATWWATAIMGAVVALGFLGQDLLAFARGQGSVVGDILKWWFGYEVKFKDIVDSCTTYFMKAFNKIISLTKKLYEKMFGNDEGTTDYREIGVRYARYKAFKRQHPEYEDMGYQEFTKFEDKNRNYESNVVKENKEINKFKYNRALRQGAQNVHSRYIHEQEVLPSYIKQVVSENNEIKKDLIAPKLAGYIGGDEETGIKIYTTNNEVVNWGEPAQAEVANRQEMKTRSYSTNNNNDVKQYITENITVNVPQGTSSDQQKVIMEQITTAIQEQFDQNILRGLDSINGGF